MNIERGRVASAVNKLHRKSPRRTQPPGRRQRERFRKAMMIYVRSNSERFIAPSRKCMQNYGNAKGFPW